MLDEDSSKISRTWDSQWTSSSCGESILVPKFLVSKLSSRNLRVYCAAMQVDSVNAKHDVRALRYLIFLLHTDCNRSSC